MHLNQLLTAEVIAALWAAGYDVVKKGEAPPWMQIVAYADIDGREPLYRIKKEN